jgi:hypothetical protein
MAAVAGRCRAGLISSLSHESGFAKIGFGHLVAGRAPAPIISVAYPEATGTPPLRRNFVLPTHSTQDVCFWPQQT